MDMPEGIGICCPKCGRELLIFDPGFKKVGKGNCRSSRRDLSDSKRCGMYFEYWFENKDLIIRLPRYLDILKEEVEEANRRREQCKGWERD